MKDSGIVGGVKESSVRVLLPPVCSACRHGGTGEDFCPELKGWGRILTGTLAASCPLGGEVRAALCDAIAGGLPAANARSRKREERSFEESADELAPCGRERALSSSEADDACGGIMALLSVLGTMGSDTTTTTNNNSNNNNNDDDDEGWEDYLPMLPPKRGGRGKKKKTVVDYLGCELPPSTYEILRDSGLPAALGSALRGLGEDDGDDGNDDDEGSAAIAERVMPLLATVLVHAFRRTEGEAGKIAAPGSSKKKRRKSRKDEGVGAATEFGADDDVLLILGLVSPLGFYT